MNLRGSIVFASGTPGDFDIWTLNLESKALQQLTSGEFWNDFPKWSPDGKHIAFVSNRSGSPHIWLMNADGSEQRKLSQGNVYHGFPSWSPDGKKILCCANYQNPDEIEVWLVDAAESADPELVVSSRGMETEPSFSPDGKRIVMASPRTGNYDIWEYTLYSKEWRQLTRHTSDDFAPAYSPDGKQIAFVSYRDPSAKKNDRDKDSDIWLLDAENPGEPVRLTKNSGADRYVAWSPDGAYLVYCATQADSRAERLRVLDVRARKEIALKYDRSGMEKELGVEVRKSGLFALLGLLPGAIARKFYDRSYFGTERNPHWKF